jgi:hypothetical protein
MSEVSKLWTVVHYRDEGRASPVCICKTEDEALDLAYRSTLDSAPGTHYQAELRDWYEVDVP